MLCLCDFHHLQLLGRGTESRDFAVILSVGIFIRLITLPCLGAAACKSGFGEGTGPSSPFQLCLPPEGFIHLRLSQVVLMTPPSMEQIPPFPSFLSSPVPSLCSKYPSPSSCISFPPALYTSESPSTRSCACGPEAHRHCPRLCGLSPEQKHLAWGRWG